LTLAPSTVSFANPPKRTSKVCFSFSLVRYTRVFFSNRHHPHHGVSGGDRTRPGLPKHPISLYTPGLHGKSTIDRNSVMPFREFATFHWRLPGLTSFLAGFLLIGGRFNYHPGLVLAANRLSLGGRQGCVAGPCFLCCFFPTSHRSFFRRPMATYGLPFLCPSFPPWRW